MKAQSEHRLPRARPPFLARLPEGELRLADRTVRLRWEAWRIGSWLVVLFSVLAPGFVSAANAQSCEAELRALQDIHAQMRAEVLAGHAAAAVEIGSRRTLEVPRGYDYERSLSCQAWYREVGEDHRAGCLLERAHDQFEDMQKRQSIAPSDVKVGAALEQVSRRAHAQLSCADKQELYLICQPSSDSVPAAWCARRIESEATLEFPRDASCKVVDGGGDDVLSVVEGKALTCAEQTNPYRDAETKKVRAERRGMVAAMGTFIALMAAFAVPATFVPEGIARSLRRVHVLHESDVARLHHRVLRARHRELPLIGMTALSVSALSSRFWWAGALTASCGITSDVMLTEYWRHGGSAKRAIGIATASVGSVAGLVLDIETLTYADVGSQRAFVPIVKLGVAQLELGLAGRF